MVIPREQHKFDPPQTSIAQGIALLLVYNSRIQVLEDA
jgi:hypothetical protein